MRRARFLAAVVLGALLAGCVTPPLPANVDDAPRASESGAVVTSSNRGTPIGSFAVPAGRAALCVVRAVGLRDDGQQGAYHVVSGAFRNVGGALASIGAVSPDVVPAIQESSWGGVMFEMRGDEVAILVLGPSDATVRWGATWDLVLTP